LCCLVIVVFYAANLIIVILTLVIIKLHISIHLLTLVTLLLTSVMAQLIFCKRCNDFVRQANNVLCFFSKVNSNIKCKLCFSYCMSLYGCKLWLLSNDSINNLCVSWQKCNRRIWGLPYNTHCFLVPLLCQCTLLVDKIHRRCINFI